MSISADTILKVLMDHHIHQDRIIWMQIRTLLILQGAILAAAYAFRGQALCMLPLIIGGILTIVLYLLVEKVWLDRNDKLADIQALAREFSGAEVKKVLSRDGDDRILRLSLSIPDDRQVAITPSGIAIRARFLFQALLLIIAMIDLISIGFFIQLPKC